MRRHPSSIPRRLVITSLAALPGLALAAGLPYISSDSMVKYASLPVTSVDSAIPQAMIQLSKDHQLFFKAFNDYTDLDGDGVPETTYKHGFDYYGYFDSYKCYGYDTSNKRFVPVTENAQFTAEAPDSANNRAAKYCDGNTWSGNFLNWATMTRVDVVRKILFGGKRTVDESNLTSSNLTVLERSYLPNDAHSFAKYYNGSDLNKLTPFTSAGSSDLRKLGVTICNTTVSTNNAESQNVTDPPLIRVAKGNFSLWAANERWQCRWHEEVISGEPDKCNSLSTQIPGCNGNDPAVSGIHAYPRGPYSTGPNSEKLAEYQGWVEVCKNGYETGDRCKTYPSGTPKPIGLLQEFGDAERMWFGMLAGTYNKNKAGGDIIENMGPFTRELNVDSDGRFVHVAGLKDESGAVNGTQSSSAFGLVNALSLYRITKYKHSDGTYGTSGNNQNNCTFGLSDFANGTCHNWGNPFGEAYLNVIRYLGNQPPAVAYRANDSTYVSGLNVPQNYSAPLNESNSCASLNVIAFNSSTISYDGDDMDGADGGNVADIGTSMNSEQLADVVGEGEGLNGKQFFMGENGSDNNQTCTAKTINSLGKVRGICPEAPRLEGTFKIAGIAWYAHTQDINKVPGIQTVNTYAVELASNVPKLEIPIPGAEGKFVTLLPACKNLSVSPSVPGGGACAIVDFKIVEPHTESGGVGTGRFYVNWEDSEQGGDFDQDMWGTISYEITGSTLKLTTDTIAQSTPYKMGFGYILSGTTNDGFHAHSGINSYATPASIGPQECGNCQTADSPTTKSYTIGDSAASLLEDPLWYAAKWGGFNDLDGDGKPGPAAEWDIVDSAGKPGADGIPDNYFLAVEPRQLEEQLRRVFEAIIGQVASGTAASVVANAREGEGAIYQALFEPTRSDNNGTEVRWIGTLHALWIDSQGYLREDGGLKGKLEGYSVDHAVELFFDDSGADPQNHRTRVRRYSGDPADPDTTLSVDEIDSLKTLWNARERLSAISDSNVQTQRSYGASASGGRYILSYLDLDLDGTVDNGEVKDFVPASFGNGTYGIVNAPNASVASKLVQYVRGTDVTGVGGQMLRTRTLDYDGDGSPETMRLGDIVQSTPTVAGTPAEAFDLLYDDQTYGAFREQYRNRRNVVYVGANDGMLHAFNAGFYDAQSSSFKTSNNGETAHPLGAELWAYVPFNLLPHLTWLTDTEYPHLWYVDAKPRVFDARVFTADEDHPHGWGTILAVGLRFGGGDLSLPAGNQNYQSGFSSFSNIPGNRQNKTIETRSALILMDVTNPEKPPKLLKEFTHDELGFATSFPTAFAMSQRGNKPGDSISDDWYLVFGSGPDNLNKIATNIADAESTRSGKLFVLNLKTLALVNNAPYDLKNAASKSFVGDPVSVDWDLDFKADGVYFGTVGGDAAGPQGKLFKFQFTDGNEAEQTAPSGWTAPKVMVDPGTPSVSTPTVTFDDRGNRWVYAGTGRLYGDADKSSTQQQYVFGVVDKIQDPSASAPLSSFASFVDVTNAKVATNGSIEGVTGVANELALVDKALTAGGWKLSLQLPSVAERSLTQMSLLGDILFASAFTPSTDLCGGQGTSRLYGLYYKTGTAKAGLPTFGTFASTVNGQAVDQAVRDVEIGPGLASSPSLHVGAARDQRGITILTQTSTGAIESEKGLVDEAARSGEIDWRERY